VARRMKDTNQASGINNAATDLKEEKAGGVSSAVASNAQSSTDHSYNFFQRFAMRIARRPKTFFWVSFTIAFALSTFGMIVGEFSVSNEEGGWQSRGTLIADRTTQILMVTQHQDLLFGPNNTVVWDDLTTNVQPGWESSEDAEEEEDDERRRRLEILENAQVLPTTTSSSSNSSSSSSPANWARLLTPRSGLDTVDTSSVIGRRIPIPHGEPVLADFLSRRLQEESTTSNRLAGCGIDFYVNGNMTSDSRLWPVWQTKDASSTALNPSVVEELCESEEQTQRLLEAAGLCLTCGEEVAEPGGRCLPPYGIVLYARLSVEGGMDMDCPTLAEAWIPYQSETEDAWKECVTFIEANPTEIGTPLYYENCPGLFYPSLLDEFFDITGSVRYTSSIFATTENMVDEMYNMVDDFGKGGDEIEGAYDTQNEDFIDILADTAVSEDMLLATGSALVTTVAILVHTRSLFLTIVGIVQIIFSFPLAFFTYRFIFGYEFFPFLNFIGVFVVFALGADHVFVAVDKWKNARLVSRLFNCRAKLGWLRAGF